MKAIYEELEKLAREINEKAEQIQADGMSIVIYVADHEKIRSLSVQGNQLALAILSIELLGILEGEKGSTNFN